MNDTAVFCNSRIDGGGEQSGAYIAKLLGAELVSLSDDNWRGQQARKQVWYMNDAVYKLNGDWREDFIKALSSAEEIYIVLNFTMGGFQKCSWLEYFPIKKILFLNTTKENEWKSQVCRELSGLPTISLAPCVDISKYLSVERIPSSLIRIGRHSRISLKYPQDPCTLYDRLTSANGHNLEFHFMLAHNKIKKHYSEDARFSFYNWNEPPVPEFLANIDIFLYQISPTCRDQGPRVIVEAMAAGIPCVTENRDGMADRITNGVSGFLSDSVDDLVDKTLLLAADYELRQEMGQNAKEYARENFSPMNWVRELS